MRDLGLKCSGEPSVLPTYSSLEFNDSIIAHGGPLFPSSS